MAPRPPSPSEMHQLSPGLTIWHRYDATVKADLFSTAISRNSETLLIDPIEFNDEESPLPTPVAAIIVTNANHFRAAQFFSSKFSVPIYATREAEISSATQISDNELVHKVRIIAIDGAARGEIALYSASEGGTLIMGDALINFGSHGFTFLPPKYCSDAKRMRKSLHRLLGLEFERMLFAHGTPIMSKARDRLVSLLVQEK